ncbi:hypothetical protein [Microbacterium sp. G2-8]|uniref:hypothetical protein n=1 Tax=Microbacterium sp. G2-8 TaxID=2842454 RepID=UPI001C8ABC38|nr:hypothetical protein [Microbacterium sp. G2-8]
MITAVTPPSTPPSPLPYAVPWAVRRDGTHPVVTNASHEPLEYARALFSDGSARVGSETWGLVLPEEEQELCLCGLDESDTVVTLSWFRTADDREYLWQFVL